MDISLLCSHIPNPRLSKRIESLSKIANRLTVIYWDRTHGYYFGEKPIGGVKYIRLNTTSTKGFVGRLRENRRLYMETLTKLMKERPDTIYVSGIECLQAAIACREECNSQVILEVSDLPARSLVERVWLIGALVERRLNSLVSLADRLVFTSPYFYYNYYIGRINISQNDIFVFENVPKRKVFESFQKTLQKNFVIGFVGGVRYLDSLITLFEACKNMDGVSIVIAGKGPKYSELLEVAQEYPNVEVTGSYDYSSSIVSIYSSITLAYSVYDSRKLNVRLALPNRLYESIVCGIPILVAKKTKLAEYVKDLGVGFSVEDNNVFQLKATIERLMSEPELMKSARERAEQLKERFYYENVERDFLCWLTESTK